MKRYTLYQRTKSMTERYFNGADDETILTAGKTLQELVPNPHLFIDRAV